MNQVSFTFKNLQEVTKVTFLKLNLLLPLHISSVFGNYIQVSLFEKQQIL